MASTINPGYAIYDYLSASSAYIRYHITGLTGSMYVTNSANLGSSFKYNFSIYTGPNFSGSNLYTGSTYTGYKPSSTYTTANFSDYCDLYVGGDNGYTTLYGYWTNKSNSAVIDNASVAFNYTTEYRARIILNYNGGTYAGQSSKDFGYSDWTTNNSVKFNLDDSERPIRNGYEFLGWSKSSNATSPTYGIVSTFYAPVNETSTLYAVWKNITYTVTCYARDTGTNTNIGTALGSKTVTSGSSISPSSFTRLSETNYPNYKYLETDSRNTSSQIINSDTTIYQYYGRNMSIVLDVNGGLENSVESPIIIPYGETKELPIPSYPGYNFLGWTKIIEENPTYISSITGDSTSDYTLYAIWELGSNIRVYTNENWQIAIPYVYENGEWKLSISKVFNNEKWRQ